MKVQAPVSDLIALRPALIDKVISRKLKDTSVSDRSICLEPLCGWVWAEKSPWRLPNSSCKDKRMTIKMSRKI
jgi:hypothetical protein